MADDRDLSWLDRFLDWHQDECKKAIGALKIDRGYSIVLTIALSLSFPLMSNALAEYVLQKWRNDSQMKEQVLALSQRLDYFHNNINPGHGLVKYVIQYSTDSWLKANESGIRRAFRDAVPHGYFALMQVLGVDSRTGKTPQSLTLDQMKDAAEKISTILMIGRATTAEESRGPATGMKKCPYCAEEIKADAIKCRYCGEML